MVNIYLPDFDEAVRACDDALNREELSECHGLVCGYLCAHPNLNLYEYQNALIARHRITAIDTELSAILEDLLDSSRTQLADGGVIFMLWLPGDDELLDMRAVSLSAWCSGFLSGLAEVFGDGLGSVSESVSEVIADLGEIARVAATETEADESEENAFSEIVEFVRVAVLIVQEELRGELHKVKE